jgi:hypothetical protein
MKQHQENSDETTGWNRRWKLQAHAVRSAGICSPEFHGPDLMAATVDHEQSVHNFRVAEAYTLAFFGKHLETRM